MLKPPLNSLLWVKLRMMGQYPKSMAAKATNTKIRSEDKICETEYTGMKFIKAAHRYGLNLVSTI